MGCFAFHSHNTFCKIQRRSSRSRRAEPQGRLFLCSTIYVMSPSILAFPRRTEQEHWRLGAKYAQIRSYTAAREKVATLSINTRLDLHSSPVFPSLFLHSPLCGRSCFLPPRSRAHIQFLIYRSNQHLFLSYLSSMPVPPTKPPLVFVQSRPGALYVDQLQYHISFAFRL